MPLPRSIMLYNDRIETTTLPSACLDIGSKEARFRRIPDSRCMIGESPCACNRHASDILNLTNSIDIVKAKSLKVRKTETKRQN
jgi:hypothetical protein